MAQFVNKLRGCMRTVNLTMLLVLNLFFIVTLNLTVVTVLVVSCLLYTSPSPRD